MSTAVIVCVRVRPLSTKEVNEKSLSIIDMQGPVTSIKDPKRPTAAPTTFTFDQSFWTVDPKSPGGNDFATQTNVYQFIGENIILKNAMDGYNACLFAYGQTGSGKTYTMMGYGEDTGIIPRLSDAVFTVQKRLNDPMLLEVRVEVTYLEIYNEKCKCLLAPGKELRVREHPTTGPYVEGLTKLIVHDVSEIESLLEDGNRSRAVAATAMNATSSRSHAIFTITLTLIKKTSETTKTDITSRINLVDLAGSERADRTGATGDTLKEGSNINKSLTTLGKVISALAEGTSAHIPFRDSCLTWLLKDNLMGNSRTVMLAALSPADSNYDETMSTLRYADRAKNLKTKAIVNEDSSAKRIRELNQEIDRLKTLLLEGTRGSNMDSPRQHVQELEKLQELLQEENVSWSDKVQESKNKEEMRRQILAEMGITTTNKKAASLVNLNEDPMMSEYVVYFLNNETVTIGCADTNTIRMVGEGIAETAHATLTHRPDGVWSIDGSAALLLFVNGLPVEEPTPLKHGDRIIFGASHVYRFNDPSATASGAVSSSKPVDFSKAMEERFSVEREQWKSNAEAEQAQLKMSFELRARTQSLKRQEAEDKVLALEESLRLQTKELNAAKRKTQQQVFVDPEPVVVVVAAPPPPKEATETLLSVNRASSPLSNVMSSRFSAMQTVVESQDTAKRATQQMQRLPPQLVRRYKVVLLGHEEVGKTSLRKCLLSDPLFFKSLPDVLATTCIEAQHHYVKIPPDPSIGDDGPCEMTLRILDFAGQEVYHTHSIFLSNRTLYCFVWKMSADEEKHSLSEHEQHRLRMWLNDVLAKAPNSAVMLIGTHLDELRDPSPTTVKYILAQAAKVITTHVETVKAAVVLEGNFAISCKGRVVSGEGLSNAKVSSLLLHMAKVARRHCVSDPVFWGGAIPGRHMMFLKQIEDIANARQKLILPLGDYRALAGKCGIGTEVELLEVSLLLHSWLVLFLFNHAHMASNPFVFLHAQWLSRIVSNLFSFSHVLHTPPELRKHIGGLDYIMTDALKVDHEGLVSFGILPPKLMPILFRQSLLQLLKREPSSEDYETCLQLLVSLDVVYVQTTTPRRGGGGSTPTTMHYIPSLFLHDIPPKELLDLMSFLFQKSTVRRVFKFNIFPRECCFRLQCRLNHLIRHVGSDAPGMQAVRSSWRYAMWLAPSAESNVRGLLWIVDETMWYICTPGGDKREEVTSENMGDHIDEIVAGLIKEYPGVRCSPREAEVENTFSEEERDAVVEYLACGMDRVMVTDILLPGLGISVPPSEGAPLSLEGSNVISVGAALDKAVQIVLARNYA